MKKITIIYTLLIFSICVTGQTLQDKKIVIQKSIDFKELQAYYSNIEFEGEKQLFIVNNGIISSNLELVKYDNKVKFMLKEEMFSENIKNHIDFVSFSIDSVFADVKFHYGINGPDFDLKFQKMGDDWEILRSGIKK